MQDTATVMVWDDVLAPSNPAFMCARCFDMLHLDANGVPLVDGYRTQPIPAGA